MVDLDNVKLSLRDLAEKTTLLTSASMCPGDRLPPQVFCSESQLSEGHGRKAAPIKASFGYKCATTHTQKEGCWIIRDI